jgi:hypothetical protein
MQGLQEHIPHIKCDCTVYMFEDKKILPPPVCCCVKCCDMISRSVAARHKRLLSSSINRSIKKSCMKVRLRNIIVFVKEKLLAKAAHHII